MASSAGTYIRIYVVCVCACVCVHACMHVSVLVCMWPNS